MSTGRVEALDTIRGAMILLMVIDHGVYDALDIFYNSAAADQYLENPVRFAVHVIGAFLFIALSGASASVSRSNWRRGGKLAALAAGVTVVTYFFNPKLFVVFGILHLLALATLLYAAAKPWLRRTPNRAQPYIYFTLMLVGMFFTKTVTVEVPWLWMFGFTTEKFASADYFPLIPWFFAYLFGVWAGPYLFGYALPGWFYKIKIRVFSAVGRRSLIVYLAHQPVLIGAMMVAADVLGR